MITDNGGILPNGLLALVVITSGVIFAYAAVELVDTAAGETENPAKVMPRAINSVIFRIAIFYVGSLILLALLLPYTAYKQGTSPFVTFFSSIGVPAAGDIMNFVVLTAAFVEPQRRALLDGPHPAVDVDERQRAKVHREDVQEGCPGRRRTATRASR